MGGYEKRIEDEGFGVSYVSNSDLDCDDCIFSISKSGYCEVYERGKPYSVLNGERCELKVSETEVY